MTSNTDPIADIHTYTTYLKKTFLPQNNSVGSYYEMMANLKSEKDNEEYIKEMNRIDGVFNLRKNEIKQEELFNKQKIIEEESVKTNDYSSDDDDDYDDGEGYEMTKYR